MSATKQYPVVPASVSFHQNTLLTAEVNGIQYAAMKPIVEGMGIDWRGQQAKIRKSKRFDDISIPLQTTGGIQEMVCMPITKLNGWLFSVNSDKVKPEIREKIHQYQEECFVVLHDYWHKGAAVNDRATIESTQTDPARLAESLMQALIASLSGLHNDKIDDLGMEIVTRLRDLAEQISDVRGREDLLPALEVLNGNVSNMRRQLVNMLPKMSIPADLVNDLRTVAERLTAIADQQDNANFAFHERLRAMEMRYRGIELNQTAKQIGGQPGVMDYVEGNVPESLRHTFNMMRIPKAAGRTMLLRFMNECLIPDPDSRVETNRLYPVYCAWCFANMNSPVPITSYRKLLKEYISNFDGMSLKMDNYVQYLTGGKVRIPKEIDRTTESQDKLPAETIVAPPAEPPAEPQPRKFAGLTSRFFGRKEGE
ncbi:MAG: phage antirepressor N-terminal domain-containing protein [Deltaproteobacteria bacterium]|nr:phage antirepressor N-terminal domain-containing protein [Deltaproteobacteria bacterium]